MEDKPQTPEFRDLMIRCAALGISLSALCRSANVNRSVPERWKYEMPESRRVYNVLIEKLEELEAIEAAKKNPEPAEV